MKLEPIERLEILHIAKHYHPSLGGIETATRELAETAAGLGLNVSCRASSEGRGRAKSFRHNGVAVKASPFLFKVFSAPIAINILLQKIGEEPILHLHLPNPLAELRILGRILFSRSLARKVVPFLHALPVGQGILGKIWFRLITSPLLDRCSAIFISDPFFLSVFPVLTKWKEKFVIMPFCVDPISDQAFQSSIEAKVMSKTVVALGRLVPYKGFSVLINAWSILKRDPLFADHQLKIAGEGPEREGLEHLIELLNLQESVTLLGSLSENEKWEMLDTATLFVAPSLTRAETFGISILEAMSRGLPVITTDLDTGVSSLARKGLCGAVVPAGNSAALAEKVKVLFQDSLAEFHGAGKANLEFVRVNHGRNILAERYQKFIRDHRLSEL